MAEKKKGLAWSSFDYRKKKAAPTGEVTLTASMVAADVGRFLERLARTTPFDHTHSSVIALLAEKYAVEKLNWNRPIKVVVKYVPYSPDTIVHVGVEDLHGMYHGYVF
jgi:hypothetical protein